MARNIYQIDAFTSQPFYGNPAAVCITDKKPSARLMQNIAMEMNLSETAFIYPGESCYMIRFYTPESEVPLCGHATLSSAHIMYETGIADKRQEIVFLSKSGKLRARFEKGWIVLNFPSFKVTPVSIPEQFIKITGIKPEELYHSDSGHGWTLALYKNEDEIRNLKPDFKAMKNSDFADLIVTSPSSDPLFDFCVRCFAPAVGINEDPVTGSAQCILVPFWHNKTGKIEFLSKQVSKRSGILKSFLRGNRVEISGQARTIFKAEMFV